MPSSLLTYRAIQSQIMSAARIFHNRHPDLGHEDIALKVMADMQLDRTPMLRDLVREVVLGLERKK